MPPCDPQSPTELLKQAVGTAIHDINNLLLIISCSTTKLMEQIPASSAASNTTQEITNASTQIAEAVAKLQAELSGPPVFAVQPSPTVEGPKTGTGETVLVVDDDSQVRQFIKTALIRGGYHVLEARHGPAAIAVALRHRGTIHLLVSDMLMPEMNGRELADALRADIPALRVLYLSGLDAGADFPTQTNATESFVQKPFRMPELLLKIREILDK